jgi:Holliday junction resolvase-like predicted endonuclease
MSSTQYVKEAIQNNKQHLKKLDRKFYMANQPMHSDYAPELDVTLLLNNEEINFYPKVR